VDDPALRRVTLGALAVAALLALGVLFAGSRPQQVGAAVALAYVLGWLLYRAVSRASGREWLARAALVHASLGLGLAAFEVPVLLGLVDYRAVFRPPIAPMHDPQNVLDLQLLFRRQANLKVKGVADGGDFGFLFHTEASEQIPFEATFDVDGFRNDAKPTRAELVFVGDSFTEALLVPSDEVVSARLGRHYRVPVANYGMMTYGPYQELEVTRRYALPLRPKVVVWLFFEGNDLGDVRYYEWATKDLPGLHASYHGLMHRTFSMNLPRTLYHLTRAFKPTGEGRSGVTPAGERIYFLHPHLPLDDKGEVALATFARLLGEAHAECHAAGARLVVAFIPDKFRVYHDLVSIGGDAEVAAWRPNSVRDRVAAVVAGISPELTFVDLGPPLAAAARAGDHPYYRVDSHWNGKGHEVAATALAAAIGAL
jgi:hypothetical protein